MINFITFDCSISRIINFLVRLVELIFGGAKPEDANIWLCSNLPVKIDRNSACTAMHAIS